MNHKVTASLICNLERLMKWQKHGEMNVQCCRRCHELLSTHVRMIFPFKIQWSRRDQRGIRKLVTQAKLLNKKIKG